MSDRPTISKPEDETVRVLDGGFWLVVAMAAVCGVLVVAMLGRAVLSPDGGGSQPGWTAAAAAVAEGSTGAAPSVGPAAPVDITSFLYPTPREAPPIELTDQDARPFSLTSFRGEPTMVFFGYTHCPDVCPATIGTIGLAMSAFGPGLHAVFVTVDPERDTTTWLKEYVRFLPAGFVALTGTADQIKATADAWGARYARVEGATPDTYSMSHTADVYIVDANGMLRGRFPFGTEAPAMTATLREVAATTVAAGPSAAASPAATVVAASAQPVPGRPMDVTVVSSSVWAGSPSPVILTLAAGGFAAQRRRAASDRPASRRPGGAPIGTDGRGSARPAARRRHRVVRGRGHHPVAGRLAARRRDDPRRHDGIRLGAADRPRSRGRRPPSARRLPPRTRRRSPTSAATPAR